MAQMRRVHSANFVIIGRIYTGRNGRFSLQELQEKFGFSMSDACKNFSKKETENDTENIFGGTKWHLFLETNIPIY